MKNPKSKIRRSSWLRLMIVLTVIVLSASGYLQACTWFIFKNDLGHYFFGRAMEWPGDLHAEIAIVPRNHQIGSFTTKYGFVGMSHSGLLYSDGMNEHGLICSSLQLDASKYMEKKEGAYHVKDLPAYLLGNTRTVDEAAAFIKSNTFYSSADFDDLAPGIALTQHYAISDASGRAVVVEFIDGRAVIHENKVGALTNDPVFEEQLKNWAKYQGKPFNEETFESFDFSSTGKFCRMAALNATQAKVPTDFDAVNRAWSMLNTVDLPQGVLYWRWVSETPQFTSYSVVGDISNRTYYFRTYDNYDIRKIDLKKIDFAAVKFQSVSIFGKADYKEFKF